MDVVLDGSARDLDAPTRTTTTWASSCTRSSATSAWNGRCRLDWVTAERTAQDRHHTGTYPSATVSVSGRSSKPVPAPNLTVEDRRPLGLDAFQNLALVDASPATLGVTRTRLTVLTDQLRPVCCNQSDGCCRAKRRLQHPACGVHDQRRLDGVDFRVAGDGGCLLFGAGVFG